MFQPVIVHVLILSQTDRDIMRICDERDQICMLVRSKADISIRNEMHDSGVSALDARSIFVARVQVERDGERDLIICRTATMAAALDKEAPPDECEQFIDELKLTRYFNSLGRQNQPYLRCLFMDVVSVALGRFAE